MVEVVAGPGAIGNVRAVACDLDGVVYIDGHEIPGSGTAMERLASAGLRVLLVTNNSMHTPRSVVEEVSRLTGYSADPADVLTSSRVTALALEGAADRAFVVGRPSIASELEGVGIEVVANGRDADVVVVGLDDGLTYDRLAEAALAIRAGAAFYATNADPTFPTRQGLKPGGGAIVAALVTATGREPVVCGKPFEPMRRAVDEAAGGGPILVIGDQPRTDMAMGKAEGWTTALVLSGVTDSVDGIPEELMPDLVAGSLLEVADAVLGQAR